MEMIKLSLISLFSLVTMDEKCAIYLNYSILDFSFFCGWYDTF